MILSWVTWLGLLIAGLGLAAPWFAAVPLEDEIGFLLRYAASPAAVQTVAQNMILTGFGIAILGALQTGFGALNRFLGMSAAGAAGPKANPPGRAVTAGAEIVERGKIQDRNFARFADGSIEVETLLGLRRFASLDDAQGFIGC